MGEESSKNGSAGEARFSREEEAQAQVEMWRYIFGFSEMAALKCAIELGIADVLERHEASGGGPITLGELSCILSCSPSLLHRIMRFLMHRGIFRQDQRPKAAGSQLLGYVQTPLSRLFTRHGEKSMAALVLLETSPVMLAPWNGLHARVSMMKPSSFEAVHGEDVWKYAANTPAHSQLINDAMACHARDAVPAIVDQLPEVFQGISSLVDVGGGDGTTVAMLVKAFPWIQRGINFDLPHVVSAAPPRHHRVEHIGGDMFHTVPKAHAAFLMWVLHDWGDEECIRILKNCREAVPQDSGKVIIAEAVIHDDEDSGGRDDQEKSSSSSSSSNNNSKFEDVGLMLDMVMMAHTTNGKERTSGEWGYVLKAAGFTRYTFHNIQAVQSVIEAFP